MSSLLDPVAASRQKLSEALDGEEPFSLKNSTVTVHLMNHWWKEYKDWEEGDRFLAAFEQNRMTVRQGPKSRTIGSTTEPLSLARKFDAVDKSSKSRPKVNFPGQIYRVGVDSIKDRMVAANFNKAETGERGKYKLGMHDLSGSLLDGDKPTIYEQLRWKSSGEKLDDWQVIFMPMAMPEDLKVFNKLNLAAKKVRTTNAMIYQRVCEMRRAMTRIKLAEETDMGAVFMDIREKDEGAPKLRYGHSALSKVAKRREAALSYPELLQRQKGNINEIVIAYRQHAGSRFPLFADYSAKEGGFVLLPEEPSTKFITGGIIPDVWAGTKEI